ncbi:hypothetical protein [Pseudonocardia acaciae]|uniref:hypothetical protein n=1 Tax=Pseudonocardia acaciae TaxID=551276 RepID=UPI000491BDDF|nr:hypothetical protein [Pseudonocardia acaciae]
MIDYGSGAGQPDHVTPAQTYSAVLGANGVVHAVLDGVVRAAFINGTLSTGRLPTVCGVEVVPTGHPPAKNAVLHEDCAAALKELPGRVEPRAGSNPLLSRSARVAVGDGSW